MIIDSARFLNFTAIASGCAGRDPQGETAIKLLVIFFKLLDRLKCFFLVFKGEKVLVIEEETKKVMLVSNEKEKLS